MRRDPFLQGMAYVDENGVELRPAVVVPAELAAMLLPAVEREAERIRERGSRTKADALEPLVARWRYVAGPAPPGLRGESRDGGEDGEPSRSEHGITTREAAARLGGCSTQWVCQLVRRAELSAHRVGNAWLVDAASVEAYRQRRAA